MNSRTGVSIDADNRPPLFSKLVLALGVPNLIHMGLGLVQALPTLVNLAEQQSKLAIAYIKGNCSLLNEKTMHEHIVVVEFYLRKYCKGPQHTVRFDFHHYKNRLEEEIEAGRRRWQRGAARRQPPSRSSPHPK
jgi:Flavin-binding monooxygenase-like